MHKKLGIWAGSSPAQKGSFDKGLSRLLECAFIPVIPEEVKKNATLQLSSSQFYLAGRDSSKIKSLLELWNTKDIEDIFCIRGGYGNLRLLQALDKVPIKKRKNLRLWGFSDYTILQHYFFNRFSMPWVHSPMLTGSSLQAPRALEKRYWPKPFGAGKALKFSLSSQSKIRISRKDLGRHLLIGGNLESFVSMLGGKYEPKVNRSYYLFIEDISEAERRLDRALTQFSNSRLFKNCKAIVLGHFTECPHSKEIISEWSERLKIPVLGSLPVGHQSPNVPIPMGVAVHIRQKSSKSFEISFPELRL